jgi:alpha-tubulin suppressor-like RCC1 family protein
LGIDGALGTGRINNEYSPPADNIENLQAGVRAISAGGAFTCALLNNFGVRCWGSNAHGQLGYGSGANLLVPATSDVSNLPGGVSSIGAGVTHTCAILAATGGIRCWGEASGGALGTGDFTSDLFVPPATDAKNISGAEFIAAGEAHTCSLALGGVRCWGTSAHGQLGDDQTMVAVLIPPASDTLAGTSAIAAGWYYTCALLSTGSLRCWGNPPGTGAPTTRSDTNFEVLSGVTSVDAGFKHTCAVVGPGEISCWGDNEYGQLGDGTTEFKANPTALPSFCPK